MPRKGAAPSKPRSPASTPRRHVARKRVSGAEYLYYRRGGVYLPLRGPEGSAAFLQDYEAAHRAFESAARDRPARSALHAIQDVVTHYLGSAEYRQLRPKTRGDYRRMLDAFRGSFGAERLADWTPARIEQLRRSYAPDPDAGSTGRPAEWNALRSRLIVAVREYLGAHPDAVPANHWRVSRRLKAPKSRAHRPWPPEVLRAAMLAATPEFRALLTAYLLTAQRGGDVTRFAPDQYDEAAATLNLVQEKTATPLLIHVPGHLARVLAEMKGRRADRLFVTPRSRAWTTANAQETLATLLRQLGLPRYTLHGLRATGPVALKMLGFENRAIRTLTGHTSDRNLEVYLQGVEGYPLAKQAQEALATAFGELLQDVLAAPDANARRFSGVTGRAARKVKEEA
jgi:hypothetical protein